MTVRKLSTFLLGGRENSSGYAENMPKPDKMGLKKKFQEKKEFSPVLCRKIHFAELAITAVKPASADEPYKTPKPELCYTAVSICQPVF